ncbi:MAG: hypothetical protein ACK5MZ_06445 [Aestuariibaculum sp.]
MMLRKIYWIILIFILSLKTAIAQDLYKTPSGNRYHLSTCRMVENVSQKLEDVFEIKKFKLTPCKICKPNTASLSTFGFSNKNKAVGASVTVQCNGKTQKGVRCKHKTRLANGYCFQHTKQSNNNTLTTYGSSKPIALTCGVKNASGGYCKRRVKGGGYCYQHK